MRVEVLRGATKLLRSTTTPACARSGSWAPAGANLLLTHLEPTLDSEIQLISDGDGVAVIGEPGAVDRFLTSQGLPSKDLGLQRLGPKIGAAAGLLQGGSEVAMNSGRWVKLTKESADKFSKSHLMKGSTDGVNRAVFTDSKGGITGLMEIVTKPGAMTANPALLAGAAGLMAQLAMQQTMDEITDYLDQINQKVEDVLRAQKDAVLADLIGVDFVIEEAMVIREEVGRVSEVTWSKVQASSATVARTQAYALRQLDAIAERLEREKKVGDLAEVAKEAETKVQEWIAVLARCFQLLDGIAVLELDRVLDASPDELDQHRIGLRAARQKRLDAISRTTAQLMSRMDDAAGTANAKVLLHPSSARSVVHSGNQVAGVVLDFQGRLGIEAGRAEVEARRWADAATEVRDKVLMTGADGVDAAKAVGSETVDKARLATGKLSSGIAERARRRRRSADAGEDELSGPSAVDDLD